MSVKRAQKFHTDDASQPRSLKPHVLICRFFRSELAFENAPYFAFRVLLLLYHLIAEYLSGSLFFEKWSSHLVLENRDLNAHVQSVA